MLEKIEEIGRVIAGQFAGVRHSTNIDENNVKQAFIKMSAIKEFQLIFETFYYYAKTNVNNYSIVICPESTVSNYLLDETRATICVNSYINKNEEYN
jgi:hypothetical protein